MPLHVEAAIRQDGTHVFGALSLHKRLNTLGSLERPPKTTMRVRAKTHLGRTGLEVRKHFFSFLYFRADDIKP